MYSYIVPDNKKIRVIVDTDAACEADDPFAIAQALLTQKFNVLAVTAAHFNQPGSMQQSFDAAKRVVDLINPNIAVLQGQKQPLNDTDTIQQDEAYTEELSPAARFIIDAALEENSQPLYVLCLGACTNVAAALRADPRIISRITVVFIGTQYADEYTNTICEFNAGNDITAANLVLASGVNVWLIPYQVYATMHVSIAELQEKVLPYGKLGSYLFNQLAQYNNSESAWWTSGDAWSLGDCPAVAVTIKPDCGQYHYAPAPLVGSDTVNLTDVTRPMIRVYDTVDSRFVLEDLFAKIKLFAA